MAHFLLSVKPYIEAEEPWQLQNTDHMSFSEVNLFLGLSTDSFTQAIEAGDFDGTYIEIQGNQVFSRKKLIQWLNTHFDIEDNQSDVYMSFSEANGFLGIGTAEFEIAVEAGDFDGTYIEIQGDILFSRNKLTEWLDSRMDSLAINNDDTE